MTSKSQLVGYVRKSKSGVLRLSIDAEAFNAAHKIQGKDGRQFVSLIVNTDKVEQIINGAREVTSICHLVEAVD